MRRHGRVSFPRWQFRQQLIRFLRRNWLMLLGFAAICTAGVVPLSFVLSGYLLGFLHGALAVFIVSVVGLFFLVNTGASRQLSGAFGEDNTREALRAAQRRHQIWGWIDNLEVQGGDVDHLVLAPSGLHAIDSKWHANLDDSILQTDAAAAQRAARRARLILRSLRHPDLEVQPVVVVWGHAQGALREHSRMIDDVEIISGRTLRRWLNQRPSGTVSKHRAEQILTALHEFKARVEPSRPGQA
jgi:hypothetical protein